MINKKTKEEYFDALENKIEDLIGDSLYIDGEVFENLHRDFISELVDEILFIRQTLGTKQSEILEEKIDSEIKKQEKENFEKAIEIYEELISRYNDYEDWNSVWVGEVDSIDDLLERFEDHFALDIIQESCDEVKEKNVFSVILKDVGLRKILVMKAITELTGLKLIEAKAMTEKAEAKVKESVSKEDAEAAKAELEAAGAVVEVINDAVTIARQLSNSRIKSEIADAKNDCTKLVTKIKELVIDKKKLEKMDTNYILDEF